MKEPAPCCDLLFVELTPLDRLPSVINPEGLLNDKAMAAQHGGHLTM
jgi:hypothetical protein